MNSLDPYRNGVFAAALILAVLAVPMALLDQPALVILDALLLAAVIGWWAWQSRAASRQAAALEREVSQLRGLTAVTRAVRASLNLDDLLTTVYLQTVRQLKINYFYVALVDESREGGVRFPLIIESRRQVALPSGPASRGLAEHVIKSREALLVERDVFVRAGELGIAPPGPEVASWLGVPLWAGVARSGEAPVGCLVVESHDPARRFTDDDREALEVIAAHTGADIENAQRYAHTGQALAELYQEAREHRDRLQAVLDSTHDGMLMIDRGGHVVLANRRVEALTGLVGDEWRRGTLTELVSSETLQVPARLGYTPDVLCDLLGALQGEPAPAGMPPVRYVFGERHLERLTVPIHDQDGVWIGLLVVLRDVTEAERLEQTRQALSSMIVHDLRSPLSAVLGSFNLIESLVPEAGDLAGVLTSTTEYSIRAIKRLLNMIESLLDISRIGSSRLELVREPTDLSGLVRMVFDDLRPLADELEVSLLLDMPDSVPPLDVDPDRVRRVLLNLVDNALKFTQAEQAVRIVVHAPHEDGLVRVDVIDAGPGIPDDQKTRLFDPYMQVDAQRARRRGSGLGLTFCRMAVEAHGGRIWIEDGAAGGSVFAFTLPVAAIDALPDDDG